MPPEPSLFCEGNCGTECSCPGFPYTCSDGCYATDCVTATAEEGLALWAIILIVVGSIAGLSLAVKCLTACLSGPGAIETPTIALVERK